MAIVNTIQRYISDFFFSHSNEIICASENINLCSHGCRLLNNTPGEYSLDDDDDEEATEDEKNHTSGNEYNLPEEDEEEYNSEEESGNPTNPAKRNPFRLLLEMMFNPVEGWKAIRRSKLSADDVAKGCFYLICAFAAISCFAELIWDASATISSCMVNGVKIFMTLFFGNFLALLMLKIGMPKKYGFISQSNFGRVFVMYNLSTLGLFYILYELFPMIGPALVFLPIWTIFLIMRGCRFFKFPPEKGNLLVTLICMYILGSPIAVNWAFDILL